MQALEQLRGLLSKESLSAYIIPTEDAHGSEYIANCDKRRAFISGFTGSAGIAVVTTEKAALWTDGRYFLQAEKQLSSAWTLMKSGMPDVPCLEEWIVQNTPKGGAIGIDSKLVSTQQAASYRSFFLQAERVFKPLAKNPVDEIWSTRPSASLAAVFVHDIKYAGVAHAEKLENVKDWLEEQGQFGWLFTALDEIAWLFNLRGADIPYNPVFMSYALVTLEEVVLFIEAAKITDDVRKHLGTSVKILPYGAVFEHIKQLQKPICIDPHNANLEVSQALGNHAVHATSPVTLWKGVKNEVEIEGMRQAHLRDGAALVSFLAWLEAELNKNPAPKLTECSVSDKLEQFRAEQRDYVSLSFETIAGSGPNGAIIHYKPEPPTCAAVTRDALFLLDSGGQYRDGTTDVTRTQHFGEPTAEEKRSFTRVLQGHIALDKAVFPQGTVGGKLDVLARLPLWQDGLNYRHGTGHGVGAFLNVHEGPHGIGSRESALRNPLQPGMTVTNEPGYYKDGHYGIRIENVMVVRTANTPNQFGGPYYCFEHITFSPIQTKMIDLSIATDDDIKWVNAYNAECLHKLSPLLKEDARLWLEKEAKPIKRG